MDWILKSSLAGLIFLLSFSLPAQEKPFAPDFIEGVETVSAEQAIEMILNESNLVVIDSRKKAEYQKGHIESAINILNTQLKQEDLETIVPDKNTQILFYCNGVRCLRSSNAIFKAKSWGYNNLVWFRGGWKEWTEKRLPVVVD